MEITGILSRFKMAKQLSTVSWQCYCPSHDDKEPSLTITKSRDKVLLKCHAGCNYKDILKKVVLNERDLFFSNCIKPKEIEAVYPYTDIGGQLLFEVVRYKPKSFVVRRPDGKGRYLYNLEGIEPVPYRLPNIPKAIAGGKQIYIVEGEKDADNLTKLGLTATTCPMGAGKWRDAYSDYLKGARVVILPDKDEPGKKHAEQVSKSLSGKASSIKVVELPGNGKDVSDWLGAGGNVEMLAGSVKMESEYLAESKQSDIPKCTNLGSSLQFTLDKWGIVITLSRIKDHTDGSTKALIAIEANGEIPGVLLRDTINLTSSRALKSLAKDLQEKKPEIDWLTLLEQISAKVIEVSKPGAQIGKLWSTDTFNTLTYKLQPLIVENEITVLFGDGESGKSYLALFCAILVTLPWTDNPFDLEPKSAKVLYLDWESGGRDRIGIRMQKLLAGLGLPPALYIDYAKCEIPLPDDLDRIIKYVKENAIDTVIIDSLAPACGGDPNAAETAIRFNQALRRLNCTVLVIAHQSKTEEGRKSIFGSVFFRNLARLVWQVKKKEQIPGSSTLDMTLVHNKENDSGRQADIGFRLMFNEDSVSVERREPSNNEATSIIPHAIDRIVEAIKTDVHTVKEIADFTGMEYGTIHKTLTRYEGKNVNREGDKWFLT